MKPIKEIDLHLKAVELMDRLDIKYGRKTCISLDEYFCEFEFTAEERDEIYDLIEAIYK